MEDPPDLSADQLFDVDRRVRSALWRFAGILGLRIVADLVRTASYPSARSVPPAFALIDLLILVALFVSYVFLAIRLTRASKTLGRNPGPVALWFIALPFLLVVVTFLARRGFHFAVLSVLLINLLYASPFVILLSIRRELERRISEATSLRSIG